MPRIILCHQVCVECLATMSNFDDSQPCSKCGAPICQSCVEGGENHADECKMFEEAGVKFDVRYGAHTIAKRIVAKLSSYVCPRNRTVDDAHKLYFLLTPLRFLLRSESDPNLLDLEDNHTLRSGTLLSCVVQANIAGKLTGLLPKGRFTAESVHRACGALDTNAYELGWRAVRGRALYKDISYINHSCSPNARKYFDSSKRMHVVAARDIAGGEEVCLSYTPPLMATAVRQVRRERGYNRKEQTVKNTACLAETLRRTRSV